MNPVIGLDVAKGESQVQAYLERKKPYKKSFKVKHDLDGLASLLDFIKEIEDIWFWCKKSTSNVKWIFYADLTLYIILINECT